MRLASQRLGGALDQAASAGDFAQFGVKEASVVDPDLGGFGTEFLDDLFEEFICFL